MRKKAITAIIMAGGKGRRMHFADKGLLILRGKPFFEHVIARLTPQRLHILINANRNLNIYAKSGYKVVSDRLPGYLGPLAAIQTGLYYSTSSWVLFVSCDTPFLPLDLLDRLWEKKATQLAAYVHDGVRGHPTLLLLNRRVSMFLTKMLAGGERKLMVFLESVQAQAVDFSDCKANLININTPHELEYWNSMKQTNSDPY